MKTNDSNEQPEAPTAVRSSDLLGVALPILQGLLASGHFTMPSTHAKEEPDVFRMDNGKDWKELDNIPVFARRYSASAVLTALELAGELIKQIKIDENAANPKTPNGSSSPTAAGRDGGAQGGRHD